MTPHKHIIALSNEFLTPTQEFMLSTREFIKNKYPMIATHINEFAKITVSGYILGSNSEISNV